eukprot:6081710-Pleurochrysis_carterae.AAC.1
MVIEGQEGRREIEKFVHGIRNGEVVGGPSNERSETRDQGRKHAILLELSESERVQKLSETGGRRDHTT